MNLNCIAKLQIVPASTPYATAAGDGDDACNRTKAEANCTLLAPEASVPEHPGEAAHRRRGIRCNAGLDGAEVRGEGRAATEAEPAEPEKDDSEDNVEGVVCGGAGGNVEHPGSPSPPPTSVFSGRRIYGQQEASKAPS